MALTITIPGAVEATIGATAPAVLTIGVGTPGATGPAGPGVPVGGTAGQFLTKIDSTNYNTDWTTVNLSQYAVKANNLSDLPSAPTARTNLGLGSLAVVNDAPSNGSQYARKNAAWEVVTTTPDFISSVTAPLAVATGNLTVDLSAYLPLSGGTLDANSTIDGSTATEASSFSGSGLDATLSANPSENSTFRYSGLQVQNFGGTMSVTATGLTFPNSSTQTVAFPGFNNTALTGNPTAPTPATSDNDTSIATTAYVKAQAFGDRYLSTSTTSNTVSNGNKTFTIGTGLSYTPTQNITISYDASNHMHGEVLTYDSGTGVLTVDVNHHTGSGTYASWVVNVGGVTPATSVAWGAITGTLSTQTDLQNALDLKAPLASPDFTGNVTITTNSATAALTITQDGAGDILRLNDVAGDTTFTFVDALGKVNTVAATTASAGLNVAHGAAPTSPVNGDIWTTTSGLFMRQNGTTRQYVDLDQSQTINGNKTFSNATQTLGNSTATSTINVGSGATISASTKAVNIATGGVSGSTTTTIIGPVLGASTTTIGATTAASTLNLATGATLTATTKAVNIATNAVAGATTTVVIGSTTGTSTTTLQGNLTTTGTTTAIANSTAAQTIAIGNGATISGATKAIEIGGFGSTGSTTNVSIAHNVSGPSGVSTVTIGTTTPASTVTLNGNVTAGTQAVDTNNTNLATTAYVVGQAGSATPLVNGTAAVGTSLRYARQDHVHGTDTTRAPLASPTFTGTPLSTTAAVDTNTTQIATTAYVVAQAASATPLVNGTAAVGTSLRYARADHVHPTDTSRAALNSPTFTGTPTLPTGTIATTQSPGNNTTALATTAFVTAAVPAFAATADINSPSSTTKVTSLDSVRRMLLHPGFQLLYLGAGQSQTANGGYFDNNLGGRWKQYDISTTAGSRTQFTFDNSASSLGLVGLVRGQSKGVKDFSKKIYMTGRIQLGTPSNTQRGDNNSFARINLGGKNAFGGGDLSATIKGFGWNVAGVIGNAMNLQVSNGSTLTTVASSFVPVSGQIFDWELYSDGTGNVTLTINDSVVATTTAGPTGTQATGLYLEGVDAAVASVSFAMESFGTKIYFSS